LLIVFASRCVASSVAITTSSLPNGTVETAYSAVIHASGGCTPYKWAISSGALPHDVTAKVSSTTTSLDLAGTPATAGTYSFVVKVTGCGGYVSDTSYKIVIQATANHVVDLNWKASTSADIVGYNVYRAPDATTWTKINASLTSTVSTTVRSLRQFTGHSTPGIIQVSGISLALSYCRRSRILAYALGRWRGRSFATPEERLRSG
jgi:hypothetical protein